MAKNEELDQEQEEFDLGGAMDAVAAEMEEASGGEASEVPATKTTAADTAAALAEDSAPTTEAATASAPPDGAPKTWRPEAAAEWSKLPPTVQAEIRKREEDMFKGLEGYRAEATIGKALKDTIAPYIPVLREAGLEPMRTIQGLLHSHVTLSQGTPEQKAGMFKKLAEVYGVNLDGGDPPYVDPTVQALQDKIAQLEGRVSGHDQRTQEAIKVQLSQEITAFASAPENIYFDEVATDIAQLLRSKAATTLKEAYDLAVFRNPVVRAKELARLTAESNAKATAETEAAAKKAREAMSVNVRTNQARTTSGTAPTGSMEDTMAETLAAIKSRG